MNKQCSAARIAALTKHHLDNESPLNEEVKGIEEVKYGEFGRSFPNDGGNGASVGGRGMKENKQVSANDATKDTIKMVSLPYVDEPVVVDGNTKEDVGSVMVWVKFNGIPMMAFSEDGLSIIATKLGNPLMLDSYTSDMCMQSWGRSSYARAMIDLRDDKRWKPPRCLSCKVFRHVLNECPKKIVSDVVKILNNPRQATRGVPVGPKVSFKSTKPIYRPVSNKNGAEHKWKKSKNGSSLTRDDDGNPLVRTACGTIGGKAKWDDDLYTRMMTACMKRAMGSKKENEGSSRVLPC
ncbi:ARID DNA-binding domain-containing protein [Tanacetum coccineum]